MILRGADASVVAEKCLTFCVGFVLSQLDKNLKKRERKKKMYVYADSCVVVVMRLFKLNYFSRRRLSNLSRINCANGFHGGMF